MVTIYPEIVLSSLRPLGDLVGLRAPRPPYVNLQEASSALGKVVELLVAFWAMQKQKLTCGIETTEFKESLELFQKCAQESLAILDTVGSANGSVSNQEARVQTERVGKEVDDLLKRLRSFPAPQELPDHVRRSLENLDFSNFESGDDIIARLERGEDL